MSPILGIWASQISGRLWEPQGAYDALSTVTVPATAVSSITFAAIPTGYKHLQIRAWVKGDSGGDQDTNIRLGANGSIDTGSNYSHHALYGGGSTAAANGAASQTKVVIGYNFAVGTPNPNIGSVTIIDILDYADTNKHKTIRSLGGNDKNGAGFLGLYSGNWRNTAAVNAINIYPDAGNFAQYSQFTLYGVR
jgi:hypothetical protein